MGRLHYPQLSSVVADYVFKSGQQDILRLATAKSENSGKDVVEKLRAATAISPASTVEPWQTPASQLFYKLSATHLVYLSNTKDPLNRAFKAAES